MNFKGMSWSKIESEYKSAKQLSQEAALERAKLLMQIRDEQPWKDRDRYASQAAYQKFSSMSFPLILRHFGDHPVEVKNTLAVLKRFGEQKFLEVGRDALLRIMNRTSEPALQDKIVAEVTGKSEAIAAGREAGSHGAIVATVLDHYTGPSTVGSRVTKLDLLRTKKTLDKLIAIMEQCPKCSKKLEEVVKSKGTVKAA